MRSGLRQLRRQQKFANILGFTPDYGLSKSGNDDLTQIEFEKLWYGGIVNRTLIRQSFIDLSEEEIPYSEAMGDLTGWAVIFSVPDKSEFTRFKDIQVRQLVRQNHLFHIPCFGGALAEIFDSGCQIKTLKAIYSLGKREVRIDAKAVSSAIKNAVEGAVWK